MNITQQLYKPNNPLNLISKNLVIFAHIPKTAGTTINDIINANYEHIFTFYPGSKNKPNKRSLKDRINRLQEGIKGIENRDVPKLARGHFGIGMHELMGIKHCLYITLLRDPVDRVISHYYFLDQIEDFFGNSESDSNMTLERFIYERRDLLADNLQTRFLSGIGWQRNQYKDMWQKRYNKNFSLRYGDCTDKMLSYAQINLQKHMIFGLQSRFQESLNLFQKVLGWKNVDFTTKKNVNQKRPKRADLDPDLIRFIERENHLDVQLHNFALENFDRQLENLAHYNKVIDCSNSWLYPAISRQKNLNLNVSNTDDKIQLKLKEAERLLGSGNNTQGIIKYQEILQARPQYILVLYKLALAYSKDNAEDKAKNIYQRIIELNPDQDRAYAKLANLQVKENDYNNAIANFKKAISIKHNQPDWVFIGLGKALEKTQSKAPIN